MALPALYPDGPWPAPATANPGTCGSGGGGNISALVLSEVQGVCVAFDSPTLSEFPLWTRLDDPAGPFTVSGFSIERGRAYELDKSGTGTASVTIIDRNASFDPTNASGPFAGKLNPMKQAAIGLRNPVTGAWSTIFRGFVSRWGYDLYQTEDYNVVTLELVDGMDVLANAEMLPGQGFALEWGDFAFNPPRSEEHTSELQSRLHLVCRLLLEKKTKRPSREEADPVTVCPPAGSARRRTDARVVVRWRPKPATTS